MYRRRIKTVVSVLLCLILTLSLGVLAYAEGDETTTEKQTTEQKTTGTKEAVAAVADQVMEEFRNPDGRILSVSKQGDISNYPENSWQAIKSAIKKGADIVEIDVNKTADGYLMLIKDEDFSRMCVDPEGNTITSKVSETESWEVIAMCLRQGRGGEANEPTEYHPQTLEAVIKAVGDKAVLMLNFDMSIKDDVFDTVASMGAVDRVIFKINGQAGAIKKFISSHEDENIAVMGAYKGNVVFSAQSYIKKMKKASVQAVQLSAKNPNGVIFDRSVMKTFASQARAAVDMTSPSLCGERDDNEEGWNNLLERGYSIITSDYPDKLSNYIKQYEKEKESLVKLTEKAKALDLTKYGYKTATALEKEIASSENLLSIHTSKRMLNSQYSALNSAMLSLDAADGSTNGRTVTFGRILAIVLVVIAFVFSQVIIIRHSKKER